MVGFMNNVFSHLNRNTVFPWIITGAITTCFSGIGMCINHWVRVREVILSAEKCVDMSLLQVVGSVVESSYQHPNYNQLDRALGQICICGASSKTYMPNPSPHPTNKVGFKAGWRETCQTFFKKLNCFMRAQRNYRNYCNTVPSTFVQHSWTYLKTLVQFSRVTT